MMRTLRYLLLLLSISFIAAPDASAELSAEITVGGQKLQLNGAGTRSKTFIQIYESGLYLVNPSQDADAIINADELMAIRIRITSGLVSRSSLVDSFREGLVKSTGGKPGTIAMETTIFIETLKDEVKKNDVYDFVNVPGKGLYIVKNGQVLNTIPGLAFKKALFGIWLSNSPVDKELRQAMLSSNSRR